MAEDLRERGRMDKRIPPNAPHLALLSAVVLVVTGIVAALVADDKVSLTALLALIGTTVPSLVAAAFAERASRDIRNGTVVEKARQGAEKALQDTGVEQVAREIDPAALNVLIGMLENLINENGKEGDESDRGSNL